MCITTVPRPYFYDVAYTVARKQLSVVRCADSLCSGTGLSVSVYNDPGNGMEYSPSMAVDTNGLVVLGWQESMGVFSIGRCTTIQCSTVERTVIDYGGDVRDCCLPRRTVYSSVPILTYTERSVGGRSVRICLEHGDLMLYSTGYCIHRATSMITSHRRLWRLLPFQLTGARLFFTRLQSLCLVLPGGCLSLQSVHTLSLSLSLYIYMPGLPLSYPFIGRRSACGRF